jgi:hypothetical protein
MPADTHLLKMHISYALRLEPATVRRLKRAHIESVGDLVKYSKSQLLAKSGMGEKSVLECRKALLEIGLSLVGDTQELVKSVLHDQGVEYLTREQEIKLLRDRLNVLDPAGVSEMGEFCRKVLDTPQHCTFCESSDIDASDYQGNAADLSCKVSCNTCGAVWREGYLLAWAAVEQEPEVDVTKVVKYRVRYEILCERTNTHVTDGRSYFVERAVHRVGDFEERVKAWVRENDPCFKPEDDHVIMIRDIALASEVEDEDTAGDTSGDSQR